jgi:hypothetical protein
MTALFFLAAIAAILYGIFGDRKPEIPPVHKEKSFTCIARCGELEIAVHWTETENPILPTLEPTVRRWALQQDGTGDLYASLDAAIADFNAITQNIILKPVAAPETPTTRADQAKAALTSDADTLQTIGDTINALRESRSELWDNRKYQVLHELSGRVVVSGYPSQIYEDLYAGWRRVERQALADGARKRVEVLWMNF